MGFARFPTRLVSVVLALTLSLSLFGCSSVDPEKKTLDSLTEVTDGIYLLDCYTDYKVDEYLAAGITTVLDFDICFDADYSRTYSYPGKK